MKMERDSLGRKEEISFLPGRRFKVTCNRPWPENELSNDTRIKI